MMNCQEFETALRTGTPFVTLVFNDCSYGLIKWKEEDRYGENFYVDFTNPDFVKFAESMHAIGYRINSAEELILKRHSSRMFRLSLTARWITGRIQSLLSI